METCLSKGRMGFFWQCLTSHVKKATRLPNYCFRCSSGGGVLDCNAGTFCEVFCSKPSQFLSVLFCEPVWWNLLKFSANRKAKMEMEDAHLLCGMGACSC